MFIRLYVLVSLVGRIGPTGSQNGSDNSGPGDPAKQPRLDKEGVKDIPSSSNAPAQVNVGHCSLFVYSVFFNYADAGECRRF